MSRKRTIVGALAVVAATCVLCLLVAALPAISNNLRLARYAAAFQQVDQLPGSSLVDTQTRMGLLSGNGNHCDYFVGELRRYDGPQETLAAFYQSRRLSDIAYVHLAFVENGEFPEHTQMSLPYRLNSIAHWSLPVDQPTDDLYLIYTLVTGFEPGWDVRCH